jgi:hypothetical protein
MYEDKDKNADEDNKKLARRCRGPRRLSIDGENSTRYEKCAGVARADAQKIQSNCRNGLCSIEWKPKRPA